MSYQGYVFVLLLLVTTAIATISQTQKNIRTGKIAEKTNVEVCLQNECTAIIHRLAVVEAMAGTSKGKIADLEAKDAESKAKIADLEAKDVESNAKIADLEAKDVESKAKIADLEAKINTEKNERKQEFTILNEEVNVLHLNIEECMNRTLPVDGGFSKWSGYSACNASCVSCTGTQFRKRSCDAPAAQHGGNDCSAIGSSIEWRSCGELENVAFGKVATQSTTYGDGYKAENAVDGDLETTALGRGVWGWWRVDLGRPAMIFKIRVYPNGRDFGHVANATVSIGNSAKVADMTTYGILARESGQRRREGWYAFDIICEKALVGRYVHLNKHSDNGYLLAISEFEAFGRYI